MWPEYSPRLIELPDGETALDRVLATLSRVDPALKAFQVSVLLRTGEVGELIDCVPLQLMWRAGPDNGISYHIRSDQNLYCADLVQESYGATPGELPDKAYSLAITYCPEPGDPLRYPKAPMARSMAIAVARKNRIHLFPAAVAASVLKTWEQALDCTPVDTEKLLPYLDAPRWAIDEVPFCSAKVEPPDTTDRDWVNEISARTEPAGTGAFQKFTGRDISRLRQRILCSYDLWSSCRRSGLAYFDNGRRGELSEKFYPLIAFGGAKHSKKTQLEGRIVRRLALPGHLR